MKKFWQFLLGRDRLLELPLKDRLFITYLGGYNFGTLYPGRKIFSGSKLALPYGLWQRSS